MASFLSTPWKITAELKHIPGSLPKPVIYRRHRPGLQSVLVQSEPSKLSAPLLAGAQCRLLSIDSFAAEAGKVVATADPGSLVVSQD